MWKDWSFEENGQYSTLAPFAGTRKKTTTMCATAQRGSGV